MIKYLSWDSQFLNYLILHKSPYYKNKYKGPELPQSDRYSDCLVRLPLFYDLDEQEYIIKTIIDFRSY
jgi:dTDP-4-amino-4,6-dideoxygalactose transaminase